jgi:hypothetical protein
MSQSETLLGDDIEEIEAAPPPSNADVAKVVRLAERQMLLEDEIQKLNARLKAAQDELRALTESTLPLAMTECGLASFELRGGFEVEISEVIGAAITNEHRADAHAWLEKNGHGSLIKRVITITFGKGEEAWAKKFMRDMAQRKRPLAHELKESVHYQTLGAFVRERVKEARKENLSVEKLIPVDLFSVYIGKTTTIARPK